MMIIFEKCVCLITNANVKPKKQKKRTITNHPSSPLVDSPTTTTTAKAPQNLLNNLELSKNINEKKKTSKQKQQHKKEERIVYWSC